MTPGDMRLNSRTGPDRAKTPHNYYSLVPKICLISALVFGAICRPQDQKEVSHGRAKYAKLQQKRQTAMRDFRMHSFSYPIRASGPMASAAP
jgi:hypothetical protein